MSSVRASEIPEEQKMPNNDSNRNGEKSIIIQKTPMITGNNLRKTEYFWGKSTENCVKTS